MQQFPSASPGQSTFRMQNKTGGRPVGTSSRVFSGSSRQLLTRPRYPSDGLEPARTRPRKCLAGNALLAKLAKKYQKSIPQINLRFLLQKGIIPIPKASTEAHMKSNMDIFDFSISEEDMWIMTCMPQTTWLGEHPDFYIPTRKSNPEQ